MPKYVLTQGTEVFIYGPETVGASTNAVKKIEGITEFDPGSDSAGEIQVTPLAERVAHQFAPGLETPAEASFTINVDPSDPMHKYLHDSKKVALKFAIGWSDGVAPPTGAELPAVGFVLPPSRTWYTFDGYITTFPFAFAGDDVVKATVTIKRTGAAGWTPKAEV